MDRLIIGGVCATGNKRSFEARSEADPRLAHDPLRVLSQLTQCVTLGLARGSTPSIP